MTPEIDVTDQVMRILKVMGAVAAMIAIVGASEKLAKAKQQEEAARN